MREIIHWINYVLYFSIDELKRQNARSAFGYFWIVLSQFVNIIGIALVFGALFKQDLTVFFPYISAGIISWNLLSGYINESTRLYCSNAAIIQNFTFPIWIFAGQLLMKHLIIFMHGIVVQVMVIVFLGVKVSFASLLVLPNLLLVLSIMMVAGRVSAFLGARFRDFSPAVGNFIYLFFLVTPIIWERKTFPSDYSWLLNINPFTHLIDLLRAPLLGNVPEVSSYYFAIVLLLALAVVQGLVIKTQEQRVVFYV
ncbi:ABC transporter permease [Methylococcus sp. EFPC2]|uniref:ABC transporter permease n=1 Tax=Methylococcus sp. EFPC2 TaxID=2812648 RepID=UPI00196875E4|nr:ABC transporter permease [Methylococcus sp. EFPC2]QSA96818.1 ABC transporter permease [Methylococcus sp. EFPC2]